MSKAVWLLIGIVIGSLIGGIFGYLLFKNTEKTPEITQISTTSPVEQKEHSETEWPKQEKPEQPVLEQVSTKPIVTSESPPSEQKEKVDIMPADTVDQIVNPVLEDIVIKTERMVSSQKIAVTPMDIVTPILDTLTNQDSILGEMADVYSNVELNNTKLTLEYWRSPIGFQGYKMGNRKLVLFGLDPDSNQQVLEFRDTLYLKHFNSFYLLEESFDFKSYHPVIENDLIFLLTEQE